MKFINNQLEKFYQLLDIKPISSNAVSLYFILIQIANLSDNYESFQVSNKVLLLKTGIKNISALQRAKNELIKNGFITIEKGSNQNDLSKYKVVDLNTNNDKKIDEKNIADKHIETIIDTEVDNIAESASEQPNTQPNVIPFNINIIYNTKLNLLFNYINNTSTEKFENIKFDDVEIYENLGISKADRKPLINILKHLDLYIDNVDILNFMSEDRILDFKIQYWIIKDLYRSSYRTLLNYISKETFKFRFAKAKENKDYSNIKEFIAYSIKCMQNELIEIAKFNGKEKICQ